MPLADWWPATWGERSARLFVYGLILAAFALAVYAVVTLANKKDKVSAGAAAFVPPWAGRALTLREPNQRAQSAGFREATDGTLTLRLIGGYVYASADPTDRLSWKHGRVQMRAIAYCDTLKVFLGVSASGDELDQSTDGVTWGRCAAMTTSNLMDVMSDGGTVVVLSAAYAESSTDLATWKRAIVVEGSNNSCGHYDAHTKKFMAASESGGIYTSDDGVTWAEEVAPDSQSVRVFCRSGDSIFALGWATSARYRVDDATEWVTLTPFSSSINHVARHGDTWVMVGDSRHYVSVDGGVTFSNGQYGRAINCTARNATVCVAVGDGGIISGDAWTALVPRNTGMFEGALNAVVWNATNELFIAAGDAGFIFTSPDGVTWTSRVSDADSTLRSAVVHGATTVICGDGGNITTSPDGTTWTSQHKGGSNLASVAADATVAGIYVCVGSSGTIWTATAVDAWTSQQLTGDPSLLSVASNGAGLYVVVGENAAMYHSADGATWEAKDAGVPYTTTLVSVVYVNGAWLMVGDEGDVWTSDDALTWTQAASMPPSTDEDVVIPVGYDAVDSLYLARGSSSAIFSSAALQSWAPLHVDQQYDAVVLRAADQWEMVGYGGTMVSDDAITWTSLQGSGEVRHASATADLVVHVERSNGVVYKSTDGETFAAVDSWFVGARGILAVTNDVWLVTTFKQVYRTTDQGKAWTQVASAPALQGFGQGIAMDVDGVVLVGTTDGRVLRSTDEGATWALVATGLLTVDDICACEGLWLVSDSQGQVAQSADGGATWEPTKIPLPLTQVRLARTPAGLPLIATRIGQTGVSLYVTEDLGDTWTLWGSVTFYGSYYGLCSLSDGVVLLANNGDQVMLTITPDGEHYETMMVSQPVDLNYPVAPLTNFQGKTQLHFAGASVATF